VCFKKVQNPELQENHNRGIPSLLGRILINEGHPSTSRAIAFPTGFSFQVSERTTNSMRWLLSRCHRAPTDGWSWLSLIAEFRLIRQHHCVDVYVPHPSWDWWTRPTSGIGGFSRHLLMLSRFHSFIINRPLSRFIGNPAHGVLL